MGNKNPVTRAARRARRQYHKVEDRVRVVAPRVARKVGTGMKKAGPVVEDIGKVTQTIGGVVAKTGGIMTMAGEGMATAAPFVAATGFEPLAAAMVAGSAGLVAGGEVLGTAGTASVGIGKGLSETGALMTHYGQGIRKATINKEHHDHYEVAHNTYLEDHEKHIPGFTLDVDLSKDRKVDVWKKNEGNDVYIGYQGSVFERNHKGYEDTIADWHVLRDNLEESPMYVKADQVTQQVFDKYGANNKIHSGSHSLGASVAHKLACKYKFHSVVTFNAGRTPWTKRCEEPESDVTNYTTGYDLVSASNIIPRRRERTYVIETQNTAPIRNVPAYHGIENFRPNDRGSNNTWV